MKEISRQEFLRGLVVSLGGLALFGCQDRETSLSNLSRDELFDLALAKAGIEFSEKESNLWLTEIPIGEWDPTNTGDQERIAQQRMMELLGDKMSPSQNPYFKKAIVFFREDQSRMCFAFSEPEETEFKSTVIPLLTEEGEIVYLIKLALPGWRSNVGEEDGLKDIELALEMVTEFAFVKYFQRLEKEGISQGLSSEALLNFVTGPYKESDACVDCLAYVYGESVTAYFHTIGLIEMRKYGSKYEDLLEILVRNDFDVESKAWREGIVRISGACQSDLPMVINSVQPVINFS